MTGCHRCGRAGCRAPRRRPPTGLKRSVVSPARRRRRVCFPFVQSRQAKRCSTYESVAARLARLAVGDDDGLLDLAVHLEVLPEAGVGRVIRQAADEDLGERRVLDGSARRGDARVRARRRRGRAGAAAAPAARRSRSAGHARRRGALEARADRRQAAR